jgi:CTP synthase (UTP-ammonia lyase)
MAPAIRIALIGDFDPAVTAHRAIPLALRLSADRLGADLAPEWVHTSSIGVPAASRLSDFAAVWCVPASPYASTEGALAAIHFARESGLPYLGTCGGFQHAVLEYARNVLGYTAADHAETSPDAAMPVISRLSCSLVEKTGRVVFRNGSRLREIYGLPQAEEGYRCNYGLNPEYERLFPGPDGLCVSARDEAGEVRALELVGHPFFVATLYQPERSALRGAEHPLVTAFVAAAAKAAARLP